MQYATILIMIKANDVRKRFFNLLTQEYGHTIIPSASTVPENDPSVLFTTAGMQPLVPYLTGKEHPQGKRLVDIQKCVRTGDIEEVGDDTHNTFFEMMGYWSLGDYGKEQAIKQTYIFMTDPEKGLGLDPERMYVTCFIGNDDAPRDDESSEIWQKMGISKNRIYFYEKENWWAPGDNGPCGPDTEFFYDITEEGLGNMTQEEYEAADEAQQILELCNNVFMAYVKKDGKVIGELPHKNVDMGGGLERMVKVAQGVESAFETDLFLPIIEKLNEYHSEIPKKDLRIIADHIRSSVILMSDGVRPDNKDQGYILRRLLRRAVRIADRYDISPDQLSQLALPVQGIYEGVYDLGNIDEISHEIKQEGEKFQKTLKRGMKEFEKKTQDKVMSGEDAFILFTSYGFPIELIEEMVVEENISFDRVEYEKAFEAHQELSRKGAEQKFKGGLAGNGEMETKYHTATHLLHSALKKVLGDHAGQKGSNITSERLRFDFTHDAKMTDEEKTEVTRLVNEAIEAKLSVTQQDMSYDEAMKKGSVGLFTDNYGDVVSVYTVGVDDSPVSRELCGGPHVKNTGELGVFRIKKEEASSAGVRRIKAVLL